MARTTALAGLTALALLAGCGGKRTVTVGSKNFTEQVLLGELAAQQLERRLQVPVVRKLDLGGSMVAHQALLAGEVDVYPEYTGTALTAILKQPIAGDASAVRARVASEYASRWKAVWLPPLGFDDTFAMVIRGDLSRQEGITTLSQAAQRKAGWVLGVGYEFLQRPDGLPGLQKTYPLVLKEAPKTMDLGLLHKALQQGQVEMVAANSTDGLLSVLDLVSLQDDKRFFPPYEAAFVVGKRAAGDQALMGALRELSGKLDTATMRKLNFEVDGNHRRPAEVVKAFLETLK